MSSENVHVVESAFAAFSRRDEPALLALCHPDIEWVPMRASLHGRMYSGLDGVRAALADVGAEFEELRNDPRKWIELAGGRVVVSGRIVAKERTGGLRVDIPGAWLGEIRDGKLASMEAFPSEEAALEAARERE